MTDNTIDVDAVLEALAVRCQVNSIDIMTAVFMRDGKVLEVPRSERDDFRFTGLNNTYFVSNYFSGHWEHPS